MTIRAFAPADQDLLATFVLMAAFAPDGPLPPEPLSDPAASRWLMPWCTADVGVVLEDGGEVAGTAIARRVEPMLLRDAAGGAVPEVLVAVSDGLRGNGRGGALLAALARAAGAAGHEQLTLTVSPRNPARRLYLRHGYRVVAHTSAGLVVLACATPRSGT